MTLRLRLVLGLVVLVTAGLAVFGLATYQLYARSQYERLDDQLRGSAGAVVESLAREAGLAGTRPAGGPGFGGGPRGGDGGKDGGGPRDGRPAPPTVVPYGTYSELRDSSGTVVENIAQSSTAAVPALDATLGAGAESDSAGRFFSTGSAEGSGRWRVYAGPADHLSGYTVVVAVPLTEVTSALRRLVFIEGSASAALLALLAGGAWLLLRRGLRPLEQMATSARSITAGNLSERVSPNEGRTEVGQLGLALNTMLDEIESAFAERDRTEQRLRQFLADASHELRTPLTSIQGFAELFRLEGASGAGGVDLPVILRRIEEESARMKTLVEDLLLLARLDQTRPIERTPVDLGVLAADACSDAVAAAPDRPVALDAPDPVVILGDQHHLRQAIANLVTNALRHTPAGTPIEVSARIANGAATVAVRDHGGGLDDDALAHVFDRFWQADRARVGKGAGLGLAIVAGIAAEHGGEARAANAPGGGALFTLRLPVGPAPSPQIDSGLEVS
ncbi:MAG TPA: HAMP domain-containing sensor histidine kinase [Acidimicrobiia bacterium]|jgi:two-component system OmpR family sensor kinase|nr:HAMP domain-containing sensor histidine kinase [Acidimicrobiia bacterium]